MAQRIFSSPFFPNLDIFFEGAKRDYSILQSHEETWDKRISCETSECKVSKNMSRKLDLGPLLYHPVYFSLEYELRLPLLAEQRDE